MARVFADHAQYVFAFHDPATGTKVFLLMVVLS